MTAEINRRRALTTAAAVAIGAPVLAACGGGDSVSATDPEAQPRPQTDDDGAVLPLASTGDIPEGGGKILSDENVVVTQPRAGEFKCFSAVCTHQGCPVTGVTKTIDCSCHGSQFSIEDGSVVQGPATSPLGAVEITVDGDTISLA